MSVASWVAENSSVVGVTSLVAAVLVASAAVVLSAPVRPEVPLNASATFSAVAGVVLVAIAAILAALGGGRGLWLTGLGGFLCLTAVIVVQFRALHLLYRRTREILDAVGARQLTGLHVDAVNRRLEQAVRNSERLVESVLRTSQPGSAVDLDKIAQPLVEQGLWAPLSVYTSHDDGSLLKSAVVDVLAAFGCTVVAEEPVERSSWFQRFWARMRSNSVRERMRKVEQAFELQYLGKARADIDQAKAQAVAALLQAISAQDNAVVRIGSLIAIKAQGDLAVWTVSELEAADMEQHSALLRDPISALAYLRKLKQKPAEPPAHYQPRDDPLL